MGSRGKRILGAAALASAICVVLVGCASPSESAAEKCKEIASTATAYNQSKDGAGTVESVRVTKTGAPEQDVAGGAAYRMSGESKAVTDSGKATIQWTCFVQTYEGKSYAAITHWNLG